MLIKIGPSAVTSDEGFTVRRTGRHATEYHERDRYLTAYVEDGHDPEFFVGVSKGSLTQWMDGTPVTDAEREQVLRRITAANALLGVRTVVDP